MLADDIRRAQAKALDAGEAALQPIANPCAAVEFTLTEAELLRLWCAWCKTKSVRHAPAKPHVVAAFIIEQGNLDALPAIDLLHQSFDLSNPVMTGIVGAAIERVASVKPPRSWPAADKALWATLPAQIRERISMREKQRDDGLRLAQNQYAEKLKALKPDEAKPVEQKELTNESLPQRP
jgi:hypothetical protein